ncbi:hypothetical protein L1987_29896 [Smallanthus sonchifolius]|uniref:Uncharacterized protein n=1 Tax=Smallanthus sonchifolius TaxID=185202 RepID=A0ACB9I1W8_9ASTR|nr:hypothetical protein L1987_29896 [Smallanthus sonchifolius]
MTVLGGVNQSDDEKLGGAAREAKERLDERLRGPLKKDIRTSPSARFSGQVEILKKVGWGKKWLRWKSLDEDEGKCAICLDEFKAREKIAQLRCAHRFHSECLLPWLGSNAHCPCCRATVFGSG